jgi:hypothetical protein
MKGHGFDNDDFGVFSGLAEIFASEVERHKEKRRQWQSLPQAEQDLRRATHGAAVSALILFGVFYLAGFQGAFLWVAVVLHDPARFWLGTAVLALLVVSLFRCAIGVRRSWGTADGMLAGGAFLKLAGAAVALWLLWSQAGMRVIGFVPGHEGARLVRDGISAIAIWLIMTNSVRLLLTASWRPKPKLPPGMKDMHGRARRVNPEELRTGAWGAGGRRSRMDDQEV